MTILGNDYFRFGVSELEEIPRTSLMLAAFQAPVVKIKAALAWYVLIVAC